MSNRYRLLCMAVATSILCACMGPVALTKALPPHFTNTTSIVATFNFRADASIGGQFSNDPDNAYGSAGLGATIEENPTIELSPLRGEQFAEQMLTPLTDDQFRLLVTERIPMDMLIRLMAKSFHFQNEAGELTRSVRNRPDIPAEYEEFRRIAAHVAALDANADLYARRVSFVETTELQLTAPPDAADFLEARKSGFEFALKEGDTYTLSRRVVGNTVVTNYDTTILSD